MAAAVSKTIECYFTILPITAQTSYKHGWLLFIFVIDRLVYKLEMLKLLC